MAEHRDSTRRDFLQKLAATTVITTTGLGSSASARPVEILPTRPTRRVSPLDNVRIATIGMGIIGHIDTATALRAPGVELVAVADLYEGRRIHAREVFGAQVDTYVDYREILARTDVDAVLICVPDHWHARISMDAMQAGKSVYCEKPMVHSLDEGPGVIEVQKTTGRVFQVGSQYASSILYDKAQELYRDGAIGEVNMVIATFNRNSSIGAWQYSIPLDASPDTVDWDRFLGSAPRRPFDAKRFFRWRNYWDYGTAAAGDLYVHLLTGIHKTLGAIGPIHVVARGGLRHWKDGRDVPDVLTSLLDYPETERHKAFGLALQTNFVDGSGGSFGLTFVGDEGSMVIDRAATLTLTRRGLHRHTEEEVLHGYNSVRTFSEAQQEAFARAYREADTIPVHPMPYASSTFTVPEGYDERYDHFINFFDAMRDEKPVYEDAVFGYRAAAPSLLCNKSYVDGRMYGWDPVTMKVVS